MCVALHNCLVLKGLALADLAKKNKKLHEYLLLYVRLLCNINFCFGPVEMRKFKNNCSGLKIDWGSLPGCNYFEMRVTSLHCVVLHTLL